MLWTKEPTVLHAWRYSSENAIAKSKWSTERLSSFLSCSNAPVCTLFTLTWNWKALKLLNSFFLSSYFFLWLSTQNSSFPDFSFFLDSSMKHYHCLESFFPTFFHSYIHYIYWNNIFHQDKYSHTIFHYKSLKLKM